jgi:hypothetical protein
LVRGAGLDARTTQSPANRKAKGDKVTAKSGQVPISVRHAKPQAPIVMGRSVSAHHKTKLHHVKMKPLDSIDTAVSADDSY